MRTAFISLILALGLSEAASGQNLLPPDTITDLHTKDAVLFSRYAVQIYAGPAVAPKFDAATRKFRTQISNGTKWGVAFGGHFAVSIFGCGMLCLTGYVVDLKSGAIFSLPVGGDYEAPLSLQYVKDSTLLRASWQSVPSDQRSPCVYEDFVWAGNRFKSQGRRYDTRPCSAEIGSPVTPMFKSEIRGQAPFANMSKLKTGGTEFQAAVIECRRKRLSGELPNYLASAKCSNPALIEGFRASRYRYMDLIMLLAAKRLEIAEEVDQKRMTESQADFALAQTVTNITDKERARDQGSK